MDDRTEMYSLPEDVTEEYLDEFVEEMEGIVELYREWRRHGWVLDKVRFLERLEEFFVDTSNLEVRDRKVVRLH